MATTTPSFLWPVPTSSDLVKNGATAIEALGDAIDSSMTDLKGGTTGQVLSKTSNTDMDFTWIAAGGASGMTQIAQTTLASAAADITFSSIPSTYTHLLLLINGFGTSASANGAKLFLQMNGDAGSNYSYSNNVKYGSSGATVTLNGGNTNTSIDMGYVWCGTAVSALAGVEIKVLDYKGTTLQKSATYTGGSFSDATQAGSGWGRWKSTSAVTSLKLTTDATNFGIGTKATLYGLA